VRLYARGGAIGLGELTDKGELNFVELPRLRMRRNQDASGAFRWYNEYVLPESYGGKHLIVRLHGNDEDTARKFNRTENVRPIPPSDPDFKESTAGAAIRGPSIRASRTPCISAGAHSVGHARQHVNLLGYALMVNSLALHEHRRRRDLPSAA
jgi:hypothetical protein